MVTKKPDTPKRLAQRRYEEKHKEERQAKNKVFETSIDRQLYEEITVFLKKNSITMVELIYAGYQALQKQYGPKIE